MRGIVSCMTYHLLMVVVLILEAKIPAYFIEKYFKLLDFSRMIQKQREILTVQYLDKWYRYIIIDKY